MTDVANAVTSASPPELDLSRPSARITPSAPLPLPAVVAVDCDDCDPAPAGATESPTPDAGAIEPPIAAAAAYSAPSTDVFERELPLPSAQMTPSAPLSPPAAAFRDDCDPPRAVVFTVVAADCDGGAPTPARATAPPVTVDVTDPVPSTDVFERELPRPSARMVLPGLLQPRAVAAAGRGDCDPPTPVAVTVVAAGSDDCDPTPAVASTLPIAETNTVEMDVVQTEAVEPSACAKYVREFVIRFVVYMVAYLVGYGIGYLLAWLIITFIHLCGG